MSRKIHHGFTLIEVMIVVAVIAILAAIALPAYQQQIRKQRRASAEALLMDVAARQQTFLLDSRGTYAGDATCTTAGLTTLGITTIPAEVSPYFDICVMQQNATPPPTFTARATPTGDQQKDLGTGVVLTIDNAGAKAPAGVW
jgi:type IV pilus assembly protein PilE